MPRQCDENGWLVGVAQPFALADSWALLSPEQSSRIEIDRLAHHARRFFRVELTLSPPKLYPGGWPVSDAATFSLTNERGLIGDANLVTYPIASAPEVTAAARSAVAAMGGAGFDVLLTRAKRIWQIQATAEPAPLLVAAILASVLLAPILAPGGSAIFGVKGARERLAALGWR